MSTLPITHIVEIGAGDRYSSEALSVTVKTPHKVTLYEPNTLLAADLMVATKDLPHIKVHPMAVSSKTGISQLVHLGYASYLMGYPSFFRLGIEEGGQAELNPEQWVRPLARGVVTAGISEVDDGTWDILYLTCNGAELSVLTGGMKSRPKVIYTKHLTHNGEQSAEAQRVWAALNEMSYAGNAIEVNAHRTFCRVEWRKRV